jgi:hypothetical protein
MATAQLRRYVGIRIFNDSREKNRDRFFSKEDAVREKVLR